MKYKIFIFIIFFLVVISCKENRSVNDIYRYYCGKKNGYDIWVVDGYKVRQKIYNEFLYGGNEQRYLFNPPGEIWIDHAVSCEEFELTIAHELNERHLMAKFGWTYIDAHDSSLKLEVSLRRKFNEVCRKHEGDLSEMPVIDYDSIKEIKDIPDKVKLVNIYRIPLGVRNGINIWIVDGYEVRARIYPDFGFSGNDLAYHFIPPHEIWIDGQMITEEMEFCIATELKERELMAEGKTYDDAYSIAIEYNSQLRKNMENFIKKHPFLMIPDVMTRDTGKIDPNEK